MPTPSLYRDPAYRAAVRAARSNPEHAERQLDGLREYLQLFAYRVNAGRPDWAYSSSYGLVLEQGRAYSGAARPEGLRKMTNKLCYRNALWTAMDHPDWRYVEGFAVSFQGFPCDHAWVVQPDGTVVDPTWYAPDLAAYYGVVIPVDVVSGIVAHQGVYGILCNDWRNDSQILRTGRIERPERPSAEQRRAHGPG